MERSRQETRDALVTLLGGATHMGAIAFGGSTATSTTDVDSDVDIFTFCLDEHLTQVVRSTIERVRHLLPAEIVHGPMLSNRFGIKIFAIRNDGFWADVFFNSPLTFSPLPMTAKMRFADSQSRAFFEQHFSVYRAESATSQVYALDQAWVEGIDALKGMAKCVRRGVDTGFKFYSERFATIYLALRLQELGILAFDPHAIERRLHAITREHPAASSLEAELRLAMSMESVRSCYRTFEEALRRAPYGPEVLSDRRAAGLVLDRMLAAHPTTGPSSN